MPRTPRWQYVQPHGYYHVISCTINQVVILKDPDDFGHFKTLMQQAKRQFPLHLFHYALLGTHFHFGVQAIEPDDLAAAESGLDPAKVAEIDRKIRAFDPEPGAWTIRDKKQVKLLEAEILQRPSLRAERSNLIQSKVKLVLKKIQIEGEKPKLL